MSVDPCNASNERLVNSEIHNPLSNAENFKFKNTMNLCPNWPVYSMENTILLLNWKNILKYGQRRADVVVPSFDDVMNVVDVVTVDVCKKNALKNAQSEVSPLDDSELYKRKKYANPLKELKHVRHVDYQICPFAISLHGRLGKTALNFIDDFENLVKKRMNKRFDRRLWLNRIVFTIFKSIPKMISKALMSVSAHYENIAAVRFDGVEACFEDIDF
ncbi:hypothetical protein P9112_001165 [Eukaryota sp. TZLM1-RC]